MPAPNAELLVAEFLDSPAGRGSAGLKPAELRRAASLLVAAALEDLGVEPRLLDRETVRELLLGCVARRLGERDPLTAAIPEVARAFFRYLGESRMVPNAFEIEMALADIDGEFAAAARAVRPEQRVSGRTEPIVNRAAKVGRNEPCPCGSGKKFKQCCAKLG